MTNRKGNLFDGILVIVIVFLMAFGLGLAVFFIKSLTASLTPALNGTASLQGNNAVALQVVNNVDSQLPWTIDWFSLMLMLGLPLLSMALAFFNDIHPAFYWMSFGITMLIIVVGTWLATGWQQLMASGSISGATASNLPMTNWIMNNYLAYVMYVVFMIGIGTWVKTRTANAGYPQ